MKDDTVKYGHSITRRPFQPKEDTELKMKDVSDDSEKMRDGRTSGDVVSFSTPLILCISRMRNIGDQHFSRRECFFH